MVNALLRRELSLRSRSSFLIYLSRRISSFAPIPLLFSSANVILGLLFFGPGLFPFEFEDAPAPIVLCCALVVGLGVLGLGCSFPEKQDNLIDLLPKDEREVEFALPTEKLH